MTANQESQGLTYWTAETRDVMAIIQSFSDSDARHIKVELPTAKGLLKIECKK